MPTRSKARKEEPSDVGSDVVMEEAPTSHQPESKDDDMSVDQDGNDQVEEAEEDEFEEEEEEEEVQRVKLVCRASRIVCEMAGALMMRSQLPGSTPTAASFEFLNEGHTLGNALRYVINRK